MAHKKKSAGDGIASASALQTGFNAIPSAEGSLPPFPVDNGYRLEEFVRIPMRDNSREFPYFDGCKYGDALAASLCDEATTQQTMNDALDGVYSKKCDAKCAADRSMRARSAANTRWAKHRSQKEAAHA